MLATVSFFFPLKLDLFGAKMYWGPLTLGIYDPSRGMELMLVSSYIGK